MDLFPLANGLESGLEQYVIEVNKAVKDLKK
jgi:hypothetical protein